MQCTRPFPRVASGKGSVRFVLCLNLHRVASNCMVVSLVHSGDIKEVKGSDIYKVSIDESVIVERKSYTLTGKLLCHLCIYMNRGWGITSGINKVLRRVWVEVLLGVEIGRLLLRQAGQYHHLVSSQ